MILVLKIIFLKLYVFSTALNMSRTISMSAPTALNMDYAQVTIEHDGEKIIKPMLVQKLVYIIS